ncbi:conserved hypothetical protein [Theileria equi strain WA]|uniref:Rhoptry neck protein 5 n=1 Tax=Theileria equi strain WA TaxID=1537102 RepID=L1LFS7_THEEQ|nr:conserved hypothetical protein [Theileria equi strain WA]EKX74262.1 conserved hypothetical protein [Theileria equi strain WA]|eukprot:XP_004833714.1 conserved hypothetical protein [Theileria equi strain WA]
MIGSGSKSRIFYYLIILFLVINLKNVYRVYALSGEFDANGNGITQNSLTSTTIPTTINQEQSTDENKSESIDSVNKVPDLKSSDQLFPKPDSQKNEVDQSGHKPIDQLPPSDDYDEDDVRGIDEKSGEISRYTLGVDQEWLRRENAAKVVGSKLPASTSVGYNKRTHTLEPILSAQKTLGGVIQSLVDNESILRRKYSQKVKIQHDLSLAITRETAQVVSLLTSGELQKLRMKHPLVFQRLVEPLQTQHALNILLSKDMNRMKRYNKNWYSYAKNDDKKALLDELRNYCGNKALYASNIKQPKKMKKSREDVYKKLELFHNDYQCQLVVRENQISEKILRTFEQQSGLYIAPLYNSISPSIGNKWLLSKFEQYFSQSANLNLDLLGKTAYSLIGRFMLMVENGTVLPTSPSSQVALSSLTTILSNIMEGIVEPTTFLGKKKYYGFMNMCDVKCAEGLFKPKSNFFYKELLNKQLEILKWVTAFYNDDLLRIDTSAQKLLLEIMYRTTRDPGFLRSYKSVRLNIKSEFEDKDKSFIELDTPIPVPIKFQKLERVTKNTGQLQDVTDENKPTKSPIMGKFKIFMSRFLSGFRKQGSSVDNKALSSSIVPYEVFKTPKNIVASLDNLFLDTFYNIADYIKSAAEHENNVYYETLNTFVLIQNIHGAIHSFEDKKTKSLASSKTLGAVFRWLNMNPREHLSHIPNKFLPFTSLSLQLMFFLQNVVESYTMSFLGSLKGFFRGLIKFGFKGRFRPKTYAQLYEFLEPHVVYNSGKYLNSLDIISSMVSKFKDLFLSKPAIPSPIIQYITVFVGLWAKGASGDFSMSDINMDRVRKTFFLSYVSNGKSLADMATNIIMDNCKVGNHALHLGCISKISSNNKCKQIYVSLKSNKLKKVLKMLEATFHDPLDIIRLASDTARRCLAQKKQPRPRQSMKRSKPYKYFPLAKKTIKVPHYMDRLMLHSEFSHRIHCYKAQKRLVKEMIKSLSSAVSEDSARKIISTVFSSYRSIEIKQVGMANSSYRLICPFMYDAPEELRNIHQLNIIKYVISKAVSKARFSPERKRLLTSLQSQPHKLYPTIQMEPLADLPGCVLVGTRKYNGVSYSGGYAPLEKIAYPDNVVVKPGEGRLVYDGSGFVPELMALRETVNVESISVRFEGGYNKYYYNMTDGTQVDERNFAIDSPDFIVKSHVLTTANALIKLGFDMGRIIWCGYKHGWVADFVLSEVVGDTDVPVFNGRYWLLSRELRVEDLVGPDMKIKDGDEIKMENIDKYNIRIVNTNNEVMNLNKDSNKESSQSGDSPSNSAEGSFSTILGNITPGGVKNLVKDASYIPERNTLVIDLDAPDFVYSIGGNL